jgi:hypothetical protein
MRWILTALLSLAAQAPAPPANLPPPFPREGAVKILDNDRVQVWNIAWLKARPTPLHRHIYDLAGVYYEAGDRLITSPEGEKRAVSTPAWNITAQRAGLTHIEDGTSEAPLRGVFVEMKLPGSYGADEVTTRDAPVFPTAGGVKTLDNERVIVWEYASPPGLRRHWHSHDAVAVAIDGRNPRATWVPRGTVHESDDTGRASRLYVFELK